VVAAALGVGAICTSNDAHALGPLDVEVGLKGGVGTNPESSSPVNPLGVGLGGRAGVSIFGLYGGVQAMYYLGGSSTETVPGAGSISYSLHTVLYGVEAGYSIKLIPLLTIRPQIGVGNATFTGSAGGVSSSSSNLYLEPGVTGLVSLGLVYVGADVNYLILPSIGNGAPGNTSTEGALTVHAQVGVTF
jgi:hypothetical protein